MLSWRLSNTCDRFFCIEALEEAIRRYGTPGIFNSDQGSTFTCPDYVKVLLDNGIKVSMDGRGRVLDNIITERFWRTLEYEEVYLKDHEPVGLIPGLRLAESLSPAGSYVTMQDAQETIGRFIAMYDNERPHAACAGQPPLVANTSSFEVRIPA